VRIGGVLTVAAFLTFLFVSLRRERERNGSVNDPRVDARLANRI
jgi:hypothetical protein